MLATISAGMTNFKGAGGNQQAQLKEKRFGSGGPGGPSQEFINATNAAVMNY